MGKRKDKTPTEPTGWQDRAIALGWNRDPAKRIDLEVFAERLNEIPDGRLRGVRVSTMKIEAWWTVDLVLAGRTLEHTNATFIHHVPKAASVFGVQKQDERIWCPAHAFACGASEELPCGYDCTGQKNCTCTLCFFRDVNVPAEKRLGLVFYPQSKYAAKVALRMVGKGKKPVVQKTASKPKKAKKPKDHLLPGQVGLFGAKQ